MAKKTKDNSSSKGLIIFTAVAILATIFTVTAVNNSNGNNGEIITPSEDISEDINLSENVSEEVVSSEDISLEENPSDIVNSEEIISPEDTIPTLYLVGSFSGEDKWMSRDTILQTSECGDSWVKYQWYHEVELTSGDEFKITDGNNLWLGADIVENLNSYGLNSHDGNIQNTAGSGTLSFYLKQYVEGHYSMWINDFVASSSGDTSEEETPAVTTFSLSYSNKTTNSDSIKITNDKFEIIDEDYISSLSDYDHPLNDYIGGYCYYIDIYGMHEYSYSFTAYNYLVSSIKILENKENEIYRVYFIYKDEIIHAISRKNSVNPFVLYNMSDSYLSCDVLYNSYSSCDGIDISDYFDLYFYKKSNNFTNFRFIYKDTVYGCSKFNFDNYESLTTDFNITGDYLSTTFTIQDDNTYLFCFAIYYNPTDDLVYFLDTSNGSCMGHPSMGIPDTN